VVALAFAPDGRTLISGGRGGVQWWRLSDGSRLEDYDQETFGLRAFALSPNGTLFAYGRRDETLGIAGNPYATNQASMRFVAASSSGDKLRPWTIRSEGSYRYWVQASTNLVDWEPVASVVRTQASDTRPLIDDAAGGLPARFYRVISPP
jgi:hypothetical protein